VNGTKLIISNSFPKVNNLLINCKLSHNTLITPLKAVQLGTLKIRNSYKKSKRFVRLKKQHFEKEDLKFLYFLSVQRYICKYIPKCK